MGVIRLAHSNLRIQKIVSLIASLLVGAEAITSLEAQPPMGKETGVPSYTTFDPETTGTERGVNSIRMDCLGRLLIATGSDLVTFDGRVWVSYRQEFEGEGKMPHLLDTVLGSDGKLYAGTDSGLFEVDFVAGNKFTLISVVDEVPANWPPSFQFDRLIGEGDFIYAYGITHVARFSVRNRQMELLIDRDYGISHFLPSSEDAQYIFNTIGGLWKREEGSWTELRRTGDPITMRIVRSSIKRPDGRVFLGTEDWGVFEFDKGELKEVPTEIDDVETPPIVDMTNMPGDLYAVSLLGFGVALIDKDGNFKQVLGRSLDNRFGETENLLHAGNGIVWGSLENSIVRIRFMDPISEYANYVHHVMPFPRAEKHNGVLHLITDFNLLKAEYYKGGALKEFVERPAVVDDKLNFVLSTSDGLLCATNRRVYLLKDSNEVTCELMHDDTLLMSHVPGREDLVACISIKEYFLLRNEDGQWRKYGESVPSPGMALEVLATENDGIWVEHGLASVARLEVVNERLEVQLFDESDGIGSEWINVWNIDGEVYLSKSSGEYVHWNRDTASFDLNIGVMSNIASRFSGPTKGAMDHDGNIWVPANAEHGILLRQEDGSYIHDNRSLNPISDESIIKMDVGEFGDIWMRGRHFFARYDQDYAQAAPALEAPRIYRLELAEKRKVIYDSRWDDSGEEINLRYADNSVWFHFTDPTIGYVEKPIVQYFLEGHSEDWVDADGQESISISNISEGQYCIKIRNTMDGVVFGPEASLSFAVEPPFFRTTWAYISYVLFSAALLYGLVKYTRFLERRKSEQLHQLVKIRTRELDEANNELRVMYDKAEAGNRAKSSFIAMISHEMRTPLNSVIGPASVLIDEFKDGPERITKMLSMIHGSGRHLLSLINDILDFSGNESSKNTLVIAKFDICLMIEELADAFSMKANAKGLSFGCEIDDDLPCYWEGDVTRMRQVVINLLDNAIKCTDEGSVELVVRQDSEPRELVIEVNDTGIGVEEGLDGGIFDPFVQGGNSLNRLHEGTGLGLAICKQLVEQMEGDIGYMDRVGGGSTFWIRIPILSSERENAYEGEPMGDWRDIDFSGFRALVAEDNLGNRKVIEIHLSKIGCEVDLAASGEEALELLKEREYDIVTLDLKMPGLDGFETAKAIREMGGSYADIPLVALSAYLSDEIVERCKKSGFTEFLDKPISLEEVGQLLMRRLHQKEAAL